MVFNVMHDHVSSVPRSFSRESLGSGNSQCQTEECSIVAVAQWKV